MRRETAVFAAILLVAAMAIVLASRACREEQQPKPIASVPPAHPTPALPTPSALAEPVGYRLAGLAVGDPGSFAVFENARGETVLYRLGDTIPGLGTLTGVEEGRALVATDRGPVEFRVRPAPTPTIDLRSPTRAKTAAVTPRVTPARARTAAESHPSAVPDR